MVVVNAGGRVALFFSSIGAQNYEIRIESGTAACMVALVLTVFFCNSREAGVEGLTAASALLTERQTPKEIPHPHHPASMRNLAATTAELSAS